MDKYGVDLNPSIPRNMELETTLVKLFNERFGRILADAIMRVGRKRNVEIPIRNPEEVADHLHGCRANYCAKERKFDFIQYPMRGKRGAWHAKRIAIAAALLSSLIAPAQQKWDYRIKFIGVTDTATAKNTDQLFNDVFRARAMFIDSLDEFRVTSTLKCTEGAFKYMAKEEGFDMDEFIRADTVIPKKK